MKIDQIILENYRIYCGKTSLQLSNTKQKNISIVSGNNGFGKTSLLTSLVWCLYGKLMIDVDERYKREIYESGGYKRYCEKTLNRHVRLGKETEKQQLQSNLSTVSIYEKVTLKKQISDLNSFSVSILISDIFIPSFPCNIVQITRHYNVEKHSESVEITIDGRENELTKEVGPEIFINDFILPKEIAKFFFFDAEKIVSLAEIKTAEDKRNLSNAYAEVLGIKKYVDLKNNLENLRSRLRNKAVTQKEKDKLEKLTKEYDQNAKLIDYYDDKVIEFEESIILKKQTSEHYQEKLIREGSSITLEELKDLKVMKDHLGDEGRKIKLRLKELIDLAPFAIVSNKMSQVKKQIEIEQAQYNNISSSFIESKIQEVRYLLRQKNKEWGLSTKIEENIIDLIYSQFKINQPEEFKNLLDFDQQAKNRFYAIYENLQNAYSKSFRHLMKDLKKQKSAYAIILNKLNNAESKEKDPIILQLRKDKTKLDEEIGNLERQVIEIKAKRISLQNEINNQSKIISEFSKKIKIDDLDAGKDELAQELINELDEFIQKLKIKKKKSLEERLQNEINRLMHKTNFVSKVKAIVEGDLIDIELYDYRDIIIDKDGLSMGERQLYATALLKALVDESSIQFPIFIDSPLQKFDRKHAENVIKDFYPNVSEQVVLFPLLDGELTEREYQWLLPKVSNAYLIDNIDFEQSRFKVVQPSELFNIYHKKVADVH
jgi:DNA sulfur modification protein DndD